MKELQKDKFKGKEITDLKLENDDGVTKMFIELNNSEEVGFMPYKSSSGFMGLATNLPDSWKEEIE